MNTNRKMENPEIIIREFVWDLLEQWRGIIATGLIFAILTMGAKYALDFTALKAEQQAAIEEMNQEHTLENLLKDAGVSKLSKTIHYFKRWQDNKRYYVNSLIMHVDSTKEQRLILSYYVKDAEDGQADIASIISYYLNMQSDDALTGKLSEVIEGHPDKQYVRELFLNPSTSGDSFGSVSPASGVFTFIMVLPDNADSKAIESVITEHLASSVDEISSWAGKYTITQLPTQTMTVDSQIRRDAQHTAYANMAAAELSFNKNYRTLKDEDKIQADNIIREELKEMILNGDWSFNSSDTVTGDNSAQTNDAEADSAETMEGEETDDVLASDAGTGENIDDILEDIMMEESVMDETVSPRPVFAVIGFLLGCFLYAGLYFCRCVFFNRFRNEEEVETMTGIHSFGSIFQYPYNTPLQRFLHDEKVYARRHGESGDPMEAAARIADSVAVRAGRQGLKDLSLIVLGEPSVQADRILRKQNSILAEKGSVQIRMYNADKGASSFKEEELAEMPPVFLAVLSGISRPDAMQKVLSRLQEYDIPVIGTEFLEG